MALSSLTTPSRTAPTNKSVAQNNKSRTGAKATNARSATPPPGKNETRRNNLQQQPHSKKGPNMANKISASALLLLASFVTPAAADPLPDFSDAKYSCDKKVIEPRVALLIKGTVEGSTGLRLIYVRNAAEISRNTNNLQCDIEFVNTRYTGNAVFYWKNQDDITLYGFKHGFKQD
jgi:hypothetical protein